MNKKYFNSKDARNLIDTFGFSIFPIHGVKEDGTCTCNNPKCNNIGKHPATPDGFKSATNDIEQVKRLWAARQGLNVGIATGEKSGIFVVDIDDASAEVELRKLIDLPDTYTVATGRGKHLYFKYDKDRPVKNGAHVIPHVDIRGDGGYVAGIGSNHASGVEYTCENILEEIVPAPQELYDLLTKDKATLSLPTTTSLNLSTVDGWSMEQIKEHLGHINADCDYDTWVKIGMALHAEGLPFQLFDDWSRKGIKYDNSARDHWKSFTASGGVTYGTVVALAKQGGWRYEAATPPPLPTIHKVSEVVNEDTGEVTTVKRLPLIYASDVTPTLETNDFVEDLLCEEQFSVIYGESNCGKTFFMLDLAMHVARGKRWRDKHVEQGGVIYAALEGGHGTKNRIVAFREHYDIKDETNLAIIPSSIDFLDAEGDIVSLLNAIKEAKERIGDIKLIVIDTLARAISGGDENSSQDMGQMIIHADMIREMTGAHIAFVHHSGKDNLKGARGHSSLRAAVDTEIEISRIDSDSPSSIKVVKQREMEMIDDMAFKLERVTLGVTSRNKEVSSCVVIPCEEFVAEKTVRLNAIQTFFYDSLIFAIDELGRDKKLIHGVSKVVEYDELREVMERRGYKEMMATKNKSTEQQMKSATQTARIGLKKLGKINFNDKYLWMADVQ